MQPTIVLVHGAFGEPGTWDGVIDSLMSVQVTIASDQRSGFQLVLSLSRDSTVLRVMHPAGYFDPKIRVIIIVTVNGMPNVLMDGLIIRQEFSPSNDLGKSTLTVTGEDVSLAMSLNEIISNGTPFPIPENLRAWSKPKRRSPEACSR